MALYVNGRPINPVVSFLVSAAVIAGLIGMGILFRYPCIKEFSSSFSYVLQGSQCMVCTIVGVMAILLCVCKRRCKIRCKRLRWDRVLAELRRRRIRAKNRNFGPNKAKAGINSE